MRLYGELSSKSNSQSSEVRVPTEEFIRALAEIDARKARQAFEQAGTLTLREALQASGFEATPEELAEEVRKMREADAVEAETQKRRRRLRLILRAELASTLVCGLTLLSLSHTVYNPQWQASHQLAEMKNDLRLTQDPHARLHIFVDSPAFHPSSTPNFIVASWRRRSAPPIYPLSILPDGYNIYSYAGLNDDGRYATGAADFKTTSPAYFQFIGADQPPLQGQTVSVFYKGRLYWRGWISKADVPRLLQGQRCVYYPEPVDDPQINRADLIPLTVSLQSIEEAKAQWSFLNQTTYSIYTFPTGNKVELDGHAWETF